MYFFNYKGNVVNGKSLGFLNGHNSGSSTWFSTSMKIKEKCFCCMEKTFCRSDFARRIISQEAQIRRHVTFPI